MPIRIVPVLDVMNGVVVHGIAGRRAEYRPIQSSLTPSVEPLTVASVLVDAFQPQELYVADLDAIQGGSGPTTLYAQLRSLGISCWVDAGTNTVDQALRIAETGCQVVLGLESLTDPAAITTMMKAIPIAQMLFSLDLRDGIPLRTWANATEPSAIIRVVGELGLHRVIVLDLASVGTRRGPGTLDLLSQLHQAFPEIELITGGGIRSPSDLDNLERAGASAALVASALHDGTFPPRTMESGKHLSLPA